jgi:hypothetical protein
MLELRMRETQMNKTMRLPTNSTPQHVAKLRRQSIKHRSNAIGTCGWRNAV